MKKINKKAIRSALVHGVEQVLLHSGIVHPSKKTQKVILKASEKISMEAHHDLKKQSKKIQKAKESKKAGIKSKKAAKKPSDAPLKKSKPSSNALS